MTPPDGWEIESAPPKPPDGWEVEAATPTLPDFLRQRGKRLDDGTYAVDTPQGLARFSADGTPIYSPDEQRAVTDAGGQRVKETMLKMALAATHGAANSLTPKVAGVWEAIKADPRALALPWLFDVEAYNRGQEQARKTVDNAVDEHPLANFAGAVAMPTPGPGKAAAGASLAARFLPHAAVAGTVGALNAFGKTTEKQDAGEAAADTLAGAGGAGLIGGALGAASSRAAEGRGFLRESKMAQVRADLETLAHQRAGSVGTPTTQVLGTLERAKAVLDDPAADTSLRVVAQRVVDDPEVQQVAKMALLNRMRGIGGDMNELRALKKIASDAATGIPAKAADATSEYFDRSVIGEDVAPKAKALLLRGALGLAGGLAGSALGGEGNRGEGFVGGLAAGLVAPGTVQAARNLATSPRVRDRVLATVENAAGGLNKIQSRAPIGTSILDYLRGPATPDEKRAALIEALGAQRE